MSFTPADLAQLRERAIPRDEADRQLALLRRGPKPARLVRPCTVGDGIERLSPDDQARLVERSAAAAREGRLLKFVPASGAASRMFQDLASFRGREITEAEIEVRSRQGDGKARSLLAFLEGLERFAFWPDLREALGNRAPTVRNLLDALLSSEGLGYAALPKGLLLFHAYDGGARTAFEEHLVEAAHTVRDARGDCRLHFTISPEHREAFEARLAAVRGDYEASLGVRLRVSFSVQKPSTDTLALGADGEAFRTGDGRLLFRPGGHGALIENLNEIDGDLVLIKNIDNIVPDRRRGPTIHWKRVLVGRLVELERKVWDHRTLLSSGAATPAVLDEAVQLLDQVFHVPPPPRNGRAGIVLERLHRPIRAVGVVPNTGEPGGGPFWVVDDDGATSLQIVEGAQIDPSSEEQAAIYGSSTHFSPTDLACALRDAEGRPHDLRRFVDPEAVFLSKKSAEGRDLTALERPGLWNGAMARWLTVFVETPIETFTPVKSVLDLLRPEHQP